VAFISKKQKNHSRLNCKSNLRAKVNFELDSNLSQVHISEEFFFFFSFLCDLWLWYLPPNKRFKNKKKSFRSQIFSNFLILIYFILFDFIWFYLILFDFIWFYLIYLILFDLFDLFIYLLFQKENKMRLHLAKTEIWILHSTVATMRSAIYFNTKSTQVRNCLLNDLAHPCHILSGKLCHFPFSC